MKLRIYGIEPAVSKKKEVYYKIKTSKGDMTAFDEHIMIPIKAACQTGEELNLNVVQTEKDGRTYQNIRGFAIDNVDDEITKDIVSPQEFGKQRALERARRVELIPERKSAKGSAYEKDPVGLAVELCVAIAGFNKEISPGTMEKCIELVKQAQKGFKVYQPEN